jgi:hypothetical protein
MHIRRPKPRITAPIPQITLDGRRLELVSNHKMFGFFFDSQLNWERHISEVKDRAAKQTEPSKMPCKQKLGCRSRQTIKGASNDCIKFVCIWMQHS